MKRDKNEVHSARVRLRGALNDSLTNPEVDDIPEDFEEEEEQAQPIIRHRQRGRPKKIQTTNDGHSAAADFTTPSKRRKREVGGSGGQKIQAESFVMKLFDRSLDLSKYSEQTSLYPICRAWMANQPRNPSIRSYRDARSPSPNERPENSGEMLLKLRKGDLCEVSNMPKPKKTDVPKIPPADEQKKYNKSEEIMTDELQDSRKEDLLEQHLCKWKQIKINWQKHTKVYQRRNDINFQILQELYRP